MTVAVFVLGTLAALGITVGAWRLFRRPEPLVGPAIVKLAELRAGALAEVKDAEARAKAALVEGTKKLAEKSAEPRASVFARFGWRKK